MSVTAARGFVAAGLASGIKGAGASDLAVIATADRQPVTARGVFTTNRVQAAPVQVSREHVADGRAAAVVLSSGNANAATGEPGRRDARKMCELTAAGLGCQTKDVLIAQTGLIGIPLPMGKLQAWIPRICETVAATPEAGVDAAEAIMTTDTVRKESIVTLADGVTIGGMAKGAAMLAPSMATMLAVVTTDARVQPTVLREAMRAAVDASFHRIIVDGCTSTNDTVLVLANGAAGAAPIGVGGPAFHAFVNGLVEVCVDLAMQMARDAEGATKLAEIRVSGARTRDEARAAAHTVARSQLVQCSLNGEDPYWGRVISELGASGARFDPEQVEIAYGDGVGARQVVCANGIAAEHDVEATASIMRGHDIVIEAHLNAGDASGTVFTTDLAHAYIDENRGTS